MKYLISIVVVLLLSSCSNKEAQPCEDLLECENTCEFILKDHEASAAFLSCFNSWGVLYQDSDLNTGLIIDDFPNEYKEEGVKLILCGYARINTIPLDFPDPSIGAVYQFKAVSISETD